MMFFGPNAASPPKNTCGSVDWKVVLSITGTSHLSNWIPRSRSTHGKAFSWPMARITSSAGRNFSPTMRSALIAPCASSSYSMTSKVMPVRRPFSTTNALGEWLTTISTDSSSASSSSGTEPQAGAAAVHGGVADADDEHAPADLVDVAEGHGFQPRDADVDVGGAGLAPGKPELLALGRAGAHEYRIEAAAAQQLTHALHRRVQAQVHAHAGDHGNLFVQHAVRQAERGDVGAHQTAGLAVLLEDRDLVAKGHEIVGHGKRGAAGTDAGDALAVLGL